MTKVQLGARVPASVRDEAQALAASQGVSLNAFVEAALGRAIAAAGVEAPPGLGRLRSALAEAEVLGASAAVAILRAAIARATVDAGR